MSKLVQRTAELLSAGSDLADMVDHFCERPQQKEMAESIADAIESKRNFIAEAETGNGKTFAYLIPVLLSDKRTVISTYTKHLQDQIYIKDLPLVQQATKSTSKAVILKGRSNYLCIERLQQSLEKPSLFGEQDTLQEIKEWAEESTIDGDINLMPLIDQSPYLRSEVTSTSDNCLGSKCPCYTDCFVVKARENASKADIVIVNHSLLISDMTLKVDGFGELLPDVDTVIVDEAHKLKSVSEQSFSEQLTSKNLFNMLDELGDYLEKEAQYDDDKADQEKNEELIDAIKKCRKELFLLTQAFSRIPRSAPLVGLLKKEQFGEPYRAFRQTLEDLVQQIKPMSPQSEAIGNIFVRHKSALQFISTATEEKKEKLVWVRSGSKSFQIYQSPLDVSEMLAERMSLYQAQWIYTSATLAVNGDFTPFIKSQGLPDDCAKEVYSSPFDYADQAALYLPKGLPEPSSSDHTEKMLQAAEPLIDAMEGRSFLLFTSYKALDNARVILQDSGYQLLVQNDMPKIQLLEEFGDGKNKLLLGTSSFWEGVDMKGPALSCIIIDKLPFANHFDPLSQARIKLAVENDINYFIETTLSDAVIMLRQGVGRLIRSETDRGIVMIADKRLSTKAYGKVFLNSLPPMKVFNELPPVEDYINQ